MKRNDNLEEKPVLKMIPLGGLEQIGMNITAFEYGESIMVVDCGMGFPEDDMLGVDLVIPDVSYLEENIDRVKGFVITHGHEDHIGALPYILKKVNVPVYATKLTIGIIEHKLEEHGLLDMVTTKVVSFSQTITLGDFHVEFIRTNHSIVDAAALAIYTPQGIIVHTGDFKVDYTPIYGDAIDLQRFGELGKKGVLALLCDSTNAERAGFTPSESTVGKTLSSIFEEQKNKRIIVATFASNVDRVQQIINAAHKYGRKCAIEGRSMVNIINTAIELERLNVPEDTLVELDALKNYPDEKTVIITTGSQGERLAALSRMAGGTHKKIMIGPRDAIIFSSHPIPGNEKAITKIINEIFMRGADVIFQDTHVSGHACQEEIKLIYALTRPKYAVPVHGEFKHLKANAKIAEQMGVSRENIILLESGDVLNFKNGVASKEGRVQSGFVFVDGLGVGDVGNVVLRDRQRLSEDGIILLVMAMDAENRIVSGPEIVTRGFVYVKESDELLEDIHMLIDDTICEHFENEGGGRNKLKNSIKDAVSEFVWRRTKRRPMILPVILDID
ncbi:MAG: ribonuclease J [Lachnospiraceae bacterium]|nr:ribonuclease J [Lachnospiraceae bacterium]